MGVDFYPCDKCKECFPDCGEFYTCVEGHMYCGYCANQIGAQEQDDDGLTHSVSCPVCKDGGTYKQRIRLRIANAIAYLDDGDHYTALLELAEAMNLK